MAEGRCVIGEGVKTIERRGEYWYFDGINSGWKDISDCQIDPSTHDRRIVMGVALPQQKVKPKPIATTAVIDSEPPPTNSIMVEPIQPPIEMTPAVVQVIEVTIPEMLLEKLGDNPLAVVMAIGFAFLKSVLEGKQGKAKEEMDQKCSGRHSESDNKTSELEKKIEELTNQLNEISSSFEWEKSKYASRSDFKKLTERLETLEKEKSE